MLRAGPFSPVFGGLLLSTKIGPVFKPSGTEMARYMRCGAHRGAERSSTGSLQTTGAV